MNAPYRPTEEAYTELQLAYDFYNEELFDGQLPACMITFQRQKKTMGYFHRDRFVRKDETKTDEIALNPAFFMVVPLVEVLQTIVHEMAHQWQEHFGKPSRACYHNKEWADKMESIGLMPSDTGAPGGKRVGQFMGDYVIEQGPFDLATQKLLATGFAITWLDRFPEQPPAKYQQASEALTASSAVPETIQHAYVAPSAASAGPRPAVREEKGGIRVKYTCPTCKLNVWGKPGLRIKCADHDELLEPGGK